MSEMSRAVCLIKSKRGHWIDLLLKFGTFNKKCCRTHVGTGGVEYRKLAGAGHGARWFPTGQLYHLHSNIQVHVMSSVSETTSHTSTLSYFPHLRLCSKSNKMKEAMLVYDQIEEVKTKIYG